MIETQAPGKLFIAGEYAVVEPGQPAVLVAVDRLLTVRLEEREDAGSVRSSVYGTGPLSWARVGDRIVIDAQPLDYVASAMTVVERLRAELDLPPRFFDLQFESQLDQTDGRKFGLGSSAAVTVAVVDALNQLYELRLTSLERFQLALAAVVAISPNASGGDVAASTFGGWLRYTSPDRKQLRRDLDAGVRSMFASEAWSTWSVQSIPAPSLELLVGWTGSPASTDVLVAELRRDVRDWDGYRDFVRTSEATVDALADHLRADDPASLADVRRARTLLAELGAASGVPIETPQLHTLVEIAEQYGAAAKPSGAGGGDCGIALCAGDTGAIAEGWREAGIEPLGLRVHPPIGAIR